MSAERFVQFTSCMRSAELHRRRAESALSRGDRTGARAFAAAWVAWLQFAERYTPRRSSASEALRDFSRALKGVRL